MISAFWLYKNEGKVPLNDKIEKAFNIFFTILLVLLVMMNFYFKENNEVYTSITDKIAKVIQETELFNGKYKVYALDPSGQSADGILPYFKNAELYNIEGSLKFSMEEFNSFKSKDDKFVKIDRFAESFADDKINIGISNRKLYSAYTGNVWRVIPVLVYEKDNFRIYYLRKAKNNE